MTKHEQMTLALLADGKAYSLQEISTRLQMPPSTVKQCLRTLQTLGVDISVLMNHRYRLPAPLELLAKEQISTRLNEISRSALNQLEVHAVLDSTNDYLLSRAREHDVGSIACFSELQRAGRGRLGRRWLSPLGAGLFGSLLWQFKVPATALSGLSLAIGIAVARTLQRLGVEAVGLKWPNDILWCERKLGGILLESGDNNGVFFVVIGVGINIALPPQAVTLIDQPWVDLQEVLGTGRVSRNHLAAALVNALVEVLLPFEQGGFADLSAEWARFDQITGRRVCLHLPNKTVVGIVRGVDTQGALLLESSDGQVKPYRGGETSLRLES
ncbi:MAG: bifunctional biotin--[acetyl-CoA-carboxylase] synthetase/biotin operon repressor [Candidatus Contendobacter odensis]|uniref:Bifunctional ligase/repressor BirA n=1 Tax=Candidatus Contendibacter odensensis TaxID=1400860 RepID=A0A2G6PF96_9GAMM|nr:MAG: bifunctional biotin--[acetyl-CoA-carboxylase] synthetase/biotin operon repressor [Candidatus Contendobacter odensis]